MGDPSTSTRSPAAPPAGNTDADGEEDDEDQVDLAHIQSFADKVQHVPGHSRVQISIPKRGEKDFEPLEETVKLQEMMLNRSREALFGALQGVRGGASKSLSHALYHPGSPYPHVLVTRGHMLDSMGISVRPPADKKGKGRARNQLLPEEALWLLERGSLQIWMGEVDEAATEDGFTGKRPGQWNEEECGVVGAVEMSVTEGFAAFMGRDGLTWERYQAYAYLKRLGYTVQRTRRFLPSYFSEADPQNSSLPPFQTWWRNIPLFFSRMYSSVAQSLARLWRRLSLRIDTPLAASWRGIDYASLFRHLRIIPASHGQPLPLRPTSDNPYLPFYHVWKPAVPWSKAKWDRGSIVGLERQPPDYQISAINARVVPLPSIQQLHEVFGELPEERKGPPKRTGPQYRPVTGPPRPNPIAELKNGDRAFIVAVNDSGNTGWVRFGRSGFAEHAMI